MEDYIPYGRHAVTEEDIEAVTNVLRSEWLTTGPVVEQFELALCNRVGAEVVVAVSSGTAALHAGYLAAGIDRDDEVIVPALTFAATAYPLIQLGAKVVFVDIDPETLTIDPAAVENAVSSRTKAIVVVDFAGRPPDMHRLRSIATEAGALLIEDASHAIGSHYGTRPVGSVADVTTFSFHPVKTITTGEGGAIAAMDEEVGRRARLFRNHGLIRDPAALRHPNEGGWHQEIHHAGFNYRLSDINAALGLSQLRRLDALVEERQRLVDRYNVMLADWNQLQLPPAEPNSRISWHLYCVQIDGGRRRSVFDHLRRVGIGAQVHYLPVYRHPIFEDLGSRMGNCPNAEFAYQRLLSLPLYPGLRPEQQDRVVDELHKSLR